MSSMDRNLSSDKIASMSTEALVEHFSGFVHAIAENLRKSLRIRVDIEDLVSYGIEGLLRAHQGFDKNYNTTFTSYAYYRIRGTILDGCRREGWMKRSRAKNKVARAAGANEYMQEASGNTSLPETFSEALGQVAEIVEDTMVIVLLEEATLAQVCTVQPPQENNVHRKEAQTLVQEAAEKLDEEELDVISRFYLRDESMVDIARSRGVSKSWISRIHSRAIRKMRRHLLWKRSSMEKKLER
jgi:RNA polymerase sigma factor FliA